MTTDDRQLLIRAHRGHEASARALWERHAPRLAQFATAILRSSADADDVVQGVFVRVLHLRGAQVRAVNDPGAWLALLTRRQALNHIRSVRRRRRREELPGAGGGPSERPATPATDPPGDPALRSALDSLPRRLREVVVLKHICGLTFDQIALALGMNRNTAASRHRAALDALRRVLGPANPGANPLSPVPARPPAIAGVAEDRLQPIEVPNE